MENFKGTKGSYKVGRKSTKNNDGIYQCYVSNGKIIDSPVCTVFGKTDIECDANAKLIAHAPDMLEMLGNVNNLFIRRALPSEREVKKFARDIQDLITRATTI